MNAAHNTQIQTVISVLGRIFAIDVAVLEVNESTKLIGSLPGFDSHSVVALMLELEDEFDIEFDDDEVSAELFETVGSLADFIALKKQR